jgi:hypothetical protein
MPRTPFPIPPPWPAPHAYGNERLWLDCLIERETLRLRARYELSLDELRGLYVSDRQVDELLLRHAQQVVGDAAGSPAAALTGQAAQWREHFAADTPLELLGQRLALCAADLELVLVAFAPELDLRYDTLYAYLNNDVSRRHATVDLACRLLGGAARERIGTLAQQGILVTFEPAEHRSSLCQGLRPAAAVTRFLLGLAPAGARLEIIDGAAAAPGEAELVVCRGDDRDRLELQASALLRARGCHGLHVHPAALPDAIMTARLAGAALVLREAAPTEALAAALTAGVHVLALMPRGWQPDPACAALGPTLLDVPAATPAERQQAWHTALQAAGLPATDAPALAARFSFGPARIRQVLVQARTLRDADPTRQADAALQHAARQLAAQPLAQVAQAATRPHTWTELVLAPTTLALLREAAAAILHRQQVYREWCMQRRTGRSAGLMLLFAGASGTGKTMAASVLANHVGLELFRVDLAGVVSKYIGETEKNLDRIFHAAAEADALLLFDEADALLGKRAEVKDAHDRYANIEVAYLLQKMEEHDGVVILASNLPKNLDQAFSRRMHYVVEFARPGAPLREQLWRGIFPPELPLAPGIDYAFLADEFDLTGGDIQTIALEAAFLAASEGVPLGMPLLIRALARRQTKHGDPGAAARFRAHQRLAP